MDTCDYFSVLTGGLAAWLVVLHPRAYGLADVPAAFIRTLAALGN